MILEAFYDGTFFQLPSLAIDETEYYNNVVLAAQQAFNLAVYAAYPTAQTIEPIFTKAAGEARSLGVEAAIYTKDIVELIIGRASLQAKALKGMTE